MAPVRAVPRELGRRRFPTPGVYEGSAERGSGRHPAGVIVWTIGHGTRSTDEFVSVIGDVGVSTLIDVRRFPGSCHNPQFNEPTLRAVLEESGIAYRHAVELGGRLADEPGAPLAASAWPPSGAMPPACAANAGKRRSPRRLRSLRPASCARRHSGGGATGA